MYGAGTNYTCTGSNAPFAGSGINFLPHQQLRPAALSRQPVQLLPRAHRLRVRWRPQRVWAKGWTLDFKPYTYNYDNSEKYSNAVPITDNPALVGTTYTPLGVVHHQHLQYLVKNKLTCGVDKYNSYRTYGETIKLSQVSKFGIFAPACGTSGPTPTATSLRPIPLKNWLDAPLPNFKETFVTNSYQPFAEYEFHVTSKLSITPGVKFAYYTIGTKQYADNGGKIGWPPTGTNNPARPSSPTVAATSPLCPRSPSTTASTATGPPTCQYAQGSIVPPSACSTSPRAQRHARRHAAQAAEEHHLPDRDRPQAQERTLDADYYHIHFDNGYSSFTPQSTLASPSTT
jgi:iron complex outermembrane receptor protein